MRLIVSCASADCGGRRSGGPLAGVGGGADTLGCCSGRNCSCWFCPLREQADNAAQMIMIKNGSMIVFRLSITFLRGLRRQFEKGGGSSDPPPSETLPEIL